VAEIATEVGAVEEAAVAEEAANQVHQVPEDLDLTRAMEELEAISEAVVVMAETMVVDRRTGGR